MRFHGLMLVRDEEDVIAESLAHLLTWIDVLHIYDLGSTDATWDIVQDFAGRDLRIVPFRREPTVYADGLRCLLFNQLRVDFTPGDWVLKIDADEFYPLPPPRFVRELLQPAESMVHLQWYFFRLTTAEAGAYESSKVSVATDRHRPIGDRRRFYHISRYSEPRMFRYRPTMRWPHTVHWPYNAGLTARARIPILHYPHRDPLQMARRFALRAAMMRRDAAAGGHWRNPDWRSELVVAEPDEVWRSSQVDPRKLAGNSGLADGPLLRREAGVPLPDPHLSDQVAPPLRRLAQTLVHATMLPWLDRRRPTYDPAYRPRTLGAEENDRLGRSLLAA